MDDPLPLAAPLILALGTIVQLNVVPLTGELSAIDVAVAEHIVWAEGVAMALGIGFTTTV
jgi:predicted membrane protein